jgi:hypothetical protein
MADEKATCTVICLLPGGLKLIERAGLAMDSAVTRVQLKHGSNEGISREFIEQWTADPGLSVTTVPYLKDFIFIDKKA